MWRAIEILQHADNEQADEFALVASQLADHFRFVVICCFGFAAAFASFFLLLGAPKLDHCIISVSAYLCLS